MEINYNLQFVQVIFFFFLLFYSGEREAKVSRMVT